MDPRQLFRPETPPPLRPREESPATHLAKLRSFKKNPTSTTPDYESAVNNLWRKRYMRIFDKENAD